MIEKDRQNKKAREQGNKLPRSRVSRSQYACERRTDSLYSFLKEHPADRTPEMFKFKFK